MYRTILSLNMPRGRPPKIKKEEVQEDDEPKYVKISTKNTKLPKGSKKSLLNRELDEEEQQEDADNNAETTNLAEAPRQKRKYTKRKKVEQNVAEDDTVIKPEAKKRGRKRGRKKKDQELTFKSEEVLDYMIRNYPHMGIERIREKVNDGLKVMKELGDNPYLLYKFPHDGNTYYYDDKNAILNTDGKIVGYFIKQENGTNKMFSIQQKNKDTRTFAEVIESIEKKKR